MNPSDDIVGSIWQRSRAWSLAADDRKRWLMGARTAALTLNLAGAILATGAATMLSDRPDARTICAGLGAACLAVATSVTTKLVTTEALRSWTRARSVSEAVKAEVYTFRAKAAPYTGADALDKLRTKTTAIQSQAADLEFHVAKQNPKLVDPPPDLQPDTYITTRVEQQIKGYYRANARKYGQRLSWLRGGEFVLGLAGTALGGWATVLSSQHAPQGAPGAGLSAWVAVFTTLAAALAAHIAANRYDFIVMSYSATARRLEDLVNGWRARTDQNAEAWSAFVNACESAISIENEGWMAKWTEEKKASA